MTDISLSSRCRCCLQENPGLNIFMSEDSGSNLKLCDIYFECTNILLDTRKQMPQGLCLSCLSAMMTAYNFIKQCKDVHKYLLTVFGYSTESVKAAPASSDHEPQATEERVVEPKQKQPNKSDGNIKFEDAEEYLDYEIIYNDKNDETETQYQPDEYDEDNGDDDDDDDADDADDDDDDDDDDDNDEDADYRGETAKHKTNMNGGLSDAETEYDNLIQNTGDVIDDHDVNFDDSIDPRMCDDGLDCEICGLHTNSIGELEIHFQKHNRKKMPCTLCRKMILNIQTHMKKHLSGSIDYEQVDMTAMTTTQQPAGFNCDVCWKNLPSKVMFEKHMKTHQIGMQNIIHNSQSEAQHHTTAARLGLQKNHSMVKTLLKREVQEKIALQKQLNKEAMLGLQQPVPVALTQPVVHETEIAYDTLCAICGESFQSQELYKNHLASHAVAATAKDHVCKLCDQIFPREDELKFHLRMHSTDGRPFKCDICDKEFTQLVSLKSHMTRHKEKQVECPICHELFSRPALLTNHSRKHFNEMLYVCDICGKAFNLKEHLDEHKISHSNERHFNCEICNETFPRKTTLLLHMKTHITELFKCSNCSETFTKKSQFNSHISHCLHAKMIRTTDDEPEEQQETATQNHHQPQQQSPQQQLPQQQELHEEHLLSGIDHTADFITDDNDLIKSAIAIERLWDTNGSISDYL